MDRFVEMPSTIWTLIARARTGGAEALETVCRQYRPPVVAFARGRGLSAEEAEDAAQEVFLAILKDDVLAKADPLRGRFRSLLLAITRHVISARRRHEAAAPTLSTPLGASPAPPAEDAPDDAFDGLWVENLVRLGMNRLREDCERDGTLHFKALLLQAADGLDYAGVAKALGVNTTDVTNLLHQARLRLKRLVLAEMQGYSASMAEYEAEAACLARFLA